MRNPESKQLSRRELVLGGLASAIASGCTFTVTPPRRTDAVTIKEEPVDTAIRKFGYLNQHIEEYTDTIQTTRDLVSDELKGIDGPSHFVEKCFTAAPAKYSEPVNIDFNGIPNARFASIRDLEHLLRKSSYLDEVTLHQAPPEKDTGIICIWYGQGHVIKDFDTGKVIIARPDAITSQLMIIASAQQMAKFGVRLFCVECETNTYPATPDKPGQDRKFNRLAERDLEKMAEKAVNGASSFQILQDEYPFLDVNGVDGYRLTPIDIQLDSRIMLKHLSEKLGILASSKLLLDEEDAKAYMMYLSSHGKEGEEILTHIRYKYAAKLCEASIGMDNEGTDVVGPAIHTQLTHMKRVLKDSSFLKAQGGQQFVPNAFAMQYGLSHTGIPKACQNLGVSCIEVNATMLAKSKLQRMQQITEQDMANCRKILENLKR